MQKVIVSLLVFGLSCLPAVVLAADSSNSSDDLQRFAQRRIRQKQQQQEEQKQKRTPRATKAREQLSLLKTITAQSAQEQKQREELKKKLTAGEGVKQSKGSVRMKLPFVSKQHDGWSCGLHTATRLLKQRKYDVEYEELIKQRELVGKYVLNSDKGPYTLPHALQRILRNWHKESWWMTDVEFDVIKNLLRQKKPVAVLILIKGSTFKVDIGPRKVKVPATHWVTVSGFNDKKKTVYYYDPYEEKEQQMGYDKFLELWAFDPKEFAQDGLDPIVLAYGFLASRTIGFCN